ncbi:hypothetical protein [Spirillospora sp. NPDC047279]|uniref:hypothetical protein n=1 Tax=Spirillospora sp. NPDC047279 TaxID=3155478 RepID=UPI0033C22A78
MRRRRLGLTTAIFFVLTACVASACTSGSEDSAFNPTPKPRRPAQSVIIAGDTSNDRPPVDGEYALRTGANGTGAIAVSTDGTVYFPASSQLGHRLARISRDGRLHVLPIATEADRLIIKADTLWLMTASKNTVALESRPLRDLNRSTNLLTAQGPGGRSPLVVNSNGQALPGTEQRRLISSLGSADFSLRQDGTPILVTEEGALYEVLGGNRIRPWSPSGYRAALKANSGSGHFQLMDVVTDDQGDVLLLGDKGLVRIPSRGSATGVRFPSAVEKLPSWTTMLPLRNGTIVLLGSTEVRASPPSPGLLTPAGELRTVNWGAQPSCWKFSGTLSAVQSAQLGGVAAHPDGYYLATDFGCSTIIAFKLTAPLSGTPLPG